MFELFVKGDILWMTLLTLELVALLLAAFKAPQWVRGIGLIALCTGVLSTVVGMYVAMGALSMAGDISISLVYDGWQTTLIPIIYGLLIYVCALVISTTQRPRM